VTQVLLSLALTLVGLTLVILAALDPSDLLSRWYENNENSKLGFWAISNGPGQFRAWHFIAGVFLFGVGLTILVSLA
jgi:hypothetical protein